MKSVIILVPLVIFPPGGEPLISNASLCAEVIMKLGREKKKKSKNEQRTLNENDNNPHESHQFQMISKIEIKIKVVIFHSSH